MVHTTHVAGKPCNKILTYNSIVTDWCYNIPTIIMSMTSKKVKDIPEADSGEYL